MCTSWNRPPTGITDWRSAVATPIVFSPFGNSALSDTCAPYQPRSGTNGISFLIVAMRPSTGLAYGRGLPET